jgi:hypothetical protein
MSKRPEGAAIAGARTPYASPALLATLAECSRLAALIRSRRAQAATAEATQSTLKRKEATK